MLNCPRCGYPDRGARTLSLGYDLQVCLPCATVEAAELQQLGRVLPVEQWAVND